MNEQEFLSRTSCRIRQSSRRRRDLDHVHGHIREPFCSTQVDGWLKRRHESNTNGCCAVWFGRQTVKETVRYPWLELEGYANPCSLFLEKIFRIWSGICVRGRDYQVSKFDLSISNASLIERRPEYDWTWFNRLNILHQLLTTPFSELCNLCFSRDFPAILTCSSIRLIASSFQWLVSWKLDTSSSTNNFHALQLSQPFFF